MLIIPFIKCDSHQGPTSLASLALGLLPIGILVEEAWPLVGTNGLGCGPGPVRDVVWQWKSCCWRAEIRTGTEKDFGESFVLLVYELKGI